MTPTAPSLLNRRLLLVSGKGGVGKTAVSAALALEAVREGKRVLLAQANAAPRLNEMLGVETVDTEVREVRENLFAVNITPEAAMHQYGLIVLRFERLYKIVFENRMTRAFLKAIPGIDAWAILGKVWFHVGEKGEDGRPRFDLVIVDGNDSGHFLAMLRMPTAVMEAAPQGPMSRDAASAKELIQDPVRTAAVIVSLAEDMPTNEAIEMYAALREELGVDVGALVVNAVHPKLFPGERGRAFEAFMAAERSPDPALDPYLAAASWRTSLRRINEECVKRLSAAVPGPRALLPLVASREFGLEQTEVLRGHLKGGLRL